MKFRRHFLYVAPIVSVVFASCAKSPTSPAGAVTVTVPIAVGPANGAQIDNSAQPVTLTIANATTTAAATPVTYTFEVATDSAFTNTIQSKDAPQASGQTSVTLDVLPAGKDYYWHARTSSGDTVGSFSSGVKFTIGPAIILQVPVPLSPASGATAANARPTLVVTNAFHSGAVGAITYKFEIAKDATFSTIVAVGTVPEGSSQTSFTPSANLAFRTLYFWHVQATDATNGITTPFSPGMAFTTPSDGGDLWSGAIPPGTNGHAIKGDNWQDQTLISNGGTPFRSPTLEMRQIFDLLDRGYEPQGAIDWMHGNGYSTEAAWFPGVQVIGIKYVYLALINGRWDVVLRAEGE